MTIEERLKQATDPRIGFSRSASPISKAIRWFTGGRVSHTFGTFLLPDLPCREVLEADWPGVLIRPTAEGEHVFAEFKPPAGVDLARGMLEAAKCLGERYDFEGLAGMGPVEVARRLGLKLKNPIQGAKAKFCSELMCLAMRKAGWPGVEGLDPGSTDPEQLLRVCERAHG